MRYSSKLTIGLLIIIAVALTSVAVGQDSTTFFMPGGPPPSILTLDPQPTIEWMSDRFAWPDTVWKYIGRDSTVSDSGWIYYHGGMDRVIDTIIERGRYCFLQDERDSTCYDLGFRSDGIVVWRVLE